MIEQKKYTFKTPLVPTSGIEPLSTVLQTAAMTTSAKLALSWCSYQESNLEYILTKDALYHLTIRALVGDTGIEPVHVGIKIRCLTNLANPQ